MAKPRLNLTVSQEIIDLAKGSGLNLSAEFEEWIRIRLGKGLKMDNEEIDFDLEAAKLRQELAKLESKKELAARQEAKDKEMDMIVDSMIDNFTDVQMKNDKNLKLSDCSENRKRGLAYIISKKYNKNLTEEEAAELLEKRIKERGLNGV